MTKDIDVLKARVERLTTLHLQALGAYHTNWEMVRFTGIDVVGQERAEANAKALGMYNSYIQAVFVALGTELHMSLAKIYDDHRSALNIKRLVNYVNGNKNNLISTVDGNEDERELEEVYKGLSAEDRAEIANALDSVEGKVKRLKSLRDKVIAHADICGDDGVDRLSFKELDELIQVHAKILNIITLKYLGQTTFYEPYKDHVVRDTNRLLKLIADDYDKRTSRLLGR